MKNLVFLFFLICCHLSGYAGEIPTINPYFSKQGVIVDHDSLKLKTFSGDAPYAATFYSGAENTDGYDATYEWRFYKDSHSSEPFLVRYEENTDFTFTETGATVVELYATFVKTAIRDTIQYTEEFWAGPDGDNLRLTISIKPSLLSFPNAFSPNGDNLNDIYRAKKGYQSIVEFHAMIFNRWGQKIYEWFDPAGGWDGTHNGKDVKQGVYFMLCKAKGADGRTYTIKTDVNLLRGYTSPGSDGSEAGF